MFIASKYWPQAMRLYGMNKIDPNLTELVLHLLSSRKADAVVLPYIDMLWAAYTWPAPLSYKDKLVPIIDALRASGNVSIDQHRYYSVVRLTSDQHYPFVYPFTVAERSTSLLRALGIGWHDLEKEHVWSDRRADLELPVPEGCLPGQCSAVLTFVTYGASEKRPVSIIFKSSQGDSGTLPIVTVNSSSVTRVSIPLPISSSSNILTIDIPDAVSPNELQGSSDKRILGIGLYKVDFEKRVQKQSLAE